MNWPSQFVKHYADKFWNHYQASGWKLSSGNKIKDWRACFNSQWKTLKFKEDIDLLNKYSGGMFKMNGHAPVEVKEPISKEIAELDALLTKYRLHPTEIPFTSFANYYPYMKQERLLKVFNRGQVDEIVKMFNGDQVKCRAYCVEQTLRSYTDQNFTFSHIMNLRLKLA